MNETEFLDLLRYYFRNAKTEEVNEILSDYESHFEEGKKRGLSEEEIAKELGSPRDIYDSYQSEGVVDEKTKSAQVKETARMLAKDTAASKIQSPYRGLHYGIWYIYSPLRLLHYGRRQPCHPRRPG